MVEMTLVTDTQIIIVGVFILSMIGIIVLYKSVTFLFMRKITVSLLRKVDNTYQEIKKINVPFKRDSLDYNKKTYVLDVKEGTVRKGGIVRKNGNIELFFDVDTCLPLSFYKKEKNSSSLLYNVIKSRVWGQILGGDIASSLTMIMLILLIISLLANGYLIYVNNDLSQKILLMSEQLKKLVIK